MAAIFGGLGCALLGCGGRAQSCDTLQEDCNPAPPAPFSSAEPPPSRPPPLGAVDLDTSSLDEAAASAGCSGVGSLEKLLLPPPQEPEECYGFGPYYIGSGGSCLASWCGSLALPRVVSCSPVEMTFGGGYHYYVGGAGVSADFFFNPVELAGGAPTLNDLGGLRLELEMQPTSSGEPVWLRVELDALQAVSLGLEQIGDTLVGTLTLDPRVPGVRGPWYDDGCGAESDDNGWPLPSMACACRLDVPPQTVELYVPLAPVE